MVLIVVLIILVIPAARPAWALALPAASTRAHKKG